jgi:hypothetical protein
MKVYTYGFGVKDGWLNNYVRSGLMAEGGGVRVKRAEDVTSGKVSWDVYVELVSGAGEKKRGWKEWVSVTEKEAGMDSGSVRQYGLFAQARFERGDVISVKRAEEVLVGLGSTEEGGVTAEPTSEYVGLGADWANTVDLSAGKKAKLCNARCTMAGRTLCATTQILPGTGIVVGIGRLPCQLDPGMELRWLGALVWGEEIGYEGKECIGQVMKFNKSNDTFRSSSRVVPISAVCTCDHIDIIICT